MGFKSTDDAFGYILAMEIWWDKLEGAVPLINDGATILGASLIVEDLEVNSVSLIFEAIHDVIVCSNVMPVVA